MRNAKSKKWAKCWLCCGAVVYRHNSFPLEKQRLNNVKLGFNTQGMFILPWTCFPFTLAFRVVLHPVSLEIYAAPNPPPFFTCLSVLCALSVYVYFYMKCAWIFSRICHPPQQNELYCTLDSFLWVFFFFCLFVCLFVCCWFFGRK